MFFKIFSTLSFLFAMFVAVTLGYQVYSLAAQVGQKDRSNIGNIIKRNQPKAATSEIEINGFKLDVELADTTAKRTEGLMNRASLGANSGMLFVFPRSGVYSFWMKNTNLSLDIIWIDEGLRVVHVEEYVPRCLELVCPKYTPASDALYVLETNAGWARRSNVVIGSKVIFK